MCVFLSCRRRHTRCALVTGVQTCALPVCGAVNCSPPVPTTSWWSGTVRASGWFLSSRVRMCVRWTCPQGAWWWTGILNSDVAGLRHTRTRIMRFDVVSLFPDFVRQCAAVGVVGRAQQRELLQVETWNPRDYATDKHRSVDSN